MERESGWVDNIICVGGLYSQVHEWDYVGAEKVYKQMVRLTVVVD